MITMLGAGLSQVDLASRASVTQSVISAYESGQRQPSLPALARLIEADGFELTLGLRRQPGRLRRLSGPVGRRVRRHREDLIAAADLKPGVRERVESDLIAL